MGAMTRSYHDAVTTGLASPIGVGLYSVSEIGRLFDKPVGTVRSWVQKGLAPEPIRRRFGETTVLSFHDLVSLLVVRRLRLHNISLQKIRRAEAYLREEWGLERPFAEERIYTDGRSILAALEHGAGLLSLDRRGQKVIYEVIRDDLSDVTYGAKHLAIAWRPHKHVELRPEVQFGTPCVEGTRVTTSILYGLHHAGERIDVIASEYGLTPRTVVAAIDFEEGLRKAA